MTPPASYTLPTGPTRGWKPDAPEGTLNSVAASLVVLHSLRQSRERWLSAFPKFSSRPHAGKPQDVVPPPHTLVPLGRCHFHLGPHVFIDTSIYEANYIASGQAQAASLSSARAATPASGRTPTPGPSVNITPAIMTQINALAESDASVALLLQRVRTGSAAPDELRQLGTLVTSIASVPASAARTDFVFEFTERPGERWILPSTHAVFEWCSEHELKVRTALKTGEGRALEPIVVTLKRMSPSIGPFVERWADSAADATARGQALQALMTQASPPRYLQHQLPNGPLLDHLKNLTKPPYITRGLDPALHPPRAKRVKKDKSKEPRVLLAGPTASMSAPAPGVVASTPAPSTSTSAFGSKFIAFEPPRPQLPVSPFPAPSSIPSVIFPPAVTAVGHPGIVVPSWSNQSHPTGLASETQVSASAPAAVANLVASTSAASIPATLDKGKGRPVEDTSAASEAEAPAAPVKKRRLAVVGQPPTGNSSKTIDKTAAKPKRKSRLATVCEHCRKPLHDGEPCEECATG